MGDGKWERRFQSFSIQPLTSHFQPPTLKHFRLISNARLNPLRDLYLRPINGVVSPEPLIPPCGGTTTLNLEDGFALICLQRLSKLGFSYPAMPLTGQPVHQSPIHPGPLVLGMNPLKYRTPTADKDQQSCYFVTKFLITNF